MNSTAWQGGLGLSSGPVTRWGDRAGDDRGFIYPRPARITWTGESFSSPVSRVSPRLVPKTGAVFRGTESLLTHRWRELDSNFPFRAVNERRIAPGQDFCYPFDLQSV
jgi:hypothetical protein